MNRATAVAFVFVTGLLAACSASGSKVAQGGGYANYHSYLVGKAMKSMQGKGPANAQMALANCYANFGLSKINTWRQLEVLDAAASSSDPESSSVLQFIDGQIQAAYGSTNQLHREALQPYCPDAVSQFGQYLPD
jgi:hypothetical protein